MQVSATCTYIDPKTKQLMNCTDATTADARDVPYYFPIEIVTSERQILFSFTLGKLFFMFDSLKNLVIHRLPVYQQNLEQVNNQALIKLYQRPQFWVLGCNIQGFADHYLLKDYHLHFQVPVNSSTYLLAYHCEPDFFSKRRVLMMALLTVEDIDNKYTEQ